MASSATAQQGAPDSGQSNQEVFTFREGDWTILCPEPMTNRRCLMRQPIYCIQIQSGEHQCLLPGDARGQDAFRIGVVQARALRDDPSSADVEFITPLGTHLARGVCIYFDQNEFDQSCVPFQVCDGEGCLAGFAFSPELVNRAKRGNVMHGLIHVYDPPRSTPIRLKISLAGFTKAYDGISR